MKKNTTAGKTFMRALFPAPPSCALFLQHPVFLQLHAFVLLLQFLVFLLSTLIVFTYVWILWYFTWFVWLYKPFLYTLSGDDFFTVNKVRVPFLPFFPFLSFSLPFSATKHSSEDDNSEDGWLGLFLLEEDGYWATVWR